MREKGWRFESTGGCHSIAQAIEPALGREGVTAVAAGGVLLMSIGLRVFRMG